MADTLQLYWKQCLPSELLDLLHVRLTHLENGEYLQLLQGEVVSKLRDLPIDDPTPSAESWYQQLQQIITNSYQEQGDAAKHQILLAGYAALQAFLQSNVTGPILPFSSAKVLCPSNVTTDARRVKALRAELIRNLGRDGEAAYSLTPNIELLCFARAVVTSLPTDGNIAVLPWIRLRVNFIHQRLFRDPSPSLQEAIFSDLQKIEMLLHQKRDNIDYSQYLSSFVLERAAIRLHHGLDKEAKQDLELATKLQNFHFIITGRLGKKTKFQRTDISQLVVLAKSQEVAQQTDVANGDHLPAENGLNIAPEQPKALELNDDTLLEKIAFADRTGETTTEQEKETVPAELLDLDPASQPKLTPLDSIILLDVASSITNTNPADGITREETKPYATRVIDGGSSNWQVYTQALLIRSRVEGYSSRTVERGLLQLQAVVDQVIADTAALTHDEPNGANESEKVATSFLPKSKVDDTASAAERLLYIYQLASPFRWDLEAELASRWVSMGGLRSALEIYERLEMWPEVALCLASTDREDKAKRIVRRQLFHCTKGAEFDGDVDRDAEEWLGAERVPPPGDAPRLYCILGDIDSDLTMYEKAWDISGQRYSRAQRSIGRHYWSTRDFAKASLCYRRSLDVRPIDHGSWFAYGCCLLELSEFRRAVEAFSRAVQMDDTDAEGWSNLATALLHLDPTENLSDTTTDELNATGVDTKLESIVLDDEEDDNTPPSAPAQDPQKHIRDALSALRLASKHSPTKFKILSNLLTVAATITPPSWTDIITAQSRLIDLRCKVDGEACIDEKILIGLVDHIISLCPEGYDPSKPGLPRMTVKLVDEKIQPLVTTSASLWLIIAKLANWRGKPASALAAHEKAWRLVTQRPGWEIDGDGAVWKSIVDSTLVLCRAYEEFGPRETTEGLGAGSGEVVAKDWRFKIRNAIRSVKGKAKNNWEGSEGWARLDDALAATKN